MIRLPQFPELMEHAHAHWPQHPDIGPMTRRETALLEVFAQMLDKCNVAVGTALQSPQLKQPRYVSGYLTPHGQVWITADDEAALEWLQAKLETIEITATRP